MYEYEKAVLSKSKHKICGLWFCEIADNKKEIIREQAVDKIENEILNGRQTFALPFLGFGNTLAFEIAMELRNKHYLSLIGVLPYPSFISSLPCPEKEFWQKAYAATDWCITADQEPCQTRDEIYRKCAKGLVSACKQFIIGYTGMPNMPTFEFIQAAQKDPLAFSGYITDLGK